MCVSAQAYHAFVHPGTYCARVSGLEQGTLGKPPPTHPPHPLSHLHSYLSSTQPSQRQWDVGASRARWAAPTMPARYLPNSTYPPRVLISFNYLLTTYGARTHTERYADASRLALPATLAVAIPPACLPDRRPPCLMRPAVSAPADAVVVGEPPCPNRTCQAPRGRLPRLRRVAPAAPRLVSSCFSRSGLDQSHWALRGESTTQRPCIFSRPAAPGRRRGKSPLAPSRAVTRDTDSKGSRSDD